MNASHQNALEQMKGDANSRLVGSALIDWITDLVKDFYKIKDECVVEPDSARALGLASCSEKDWSSRSPDPKSEITGVDESTGKLK